MTEKYFNHKTDIASLVFFRICFGLLLFFSLIRFWYKGWIHDLYIKPLYHFSYFGFEFVQAPGPYTYLLFAICALSALMLAAGLFYRWASLLLFFSFTYIELMDKATYLNHYYFISLVCLLMVFLPANRSFSLDVRRGAVPGAGFIPAWNTDALKLMMGIVYVYAGMAKINSDWLLHAMPLKIWLPARNDMPLIGFLFSEAATAYVFSWLGCLYDLCIPFLLLYHRSRPFAYLAVIVFHVLTALLFPIGMFPHIMMVSALVFFPPAFHRKCLEKTAALFKSPYQPESTAVLHGSVYVRSAFILFFIVQLLFPFRHLAYPGELFWTEEGYRFSWRVMLMEKAGYAQFTVRDSQGRQQVVDNTEFLSPLQEKMMATQADMLLQYAHILRDHFKQLGFENPEVYADTYVSLNGRIGRPLIDPRVNLAAETESMQHKTWIMPFHDQIIGF